MYHRYSHKVLCSKGFRVSTGLAWIQDWWQEKQRMLHGKNANGNLRFFNLPVNRVIELGTQVEM